RRRVADDRQVSHLPLAQREQEIGRPRLGWTKRLNQDRRPVRNIVDCLQRPGADPLRRHAATTATRQSWGATASWSVSSLTVRKTAFFHRGGRRERRGRAEAEALDRWG